MSYHHQLLEEFSNCKVSLAHADATDWRMLAERGAHVFPSLGSAIEHLMNKGSDLSLTVFTAHAGGGNVDFTRHEIEELVSLCAAMRDCQD